MNDLNLFQRLAKIREAVSYIQKDAKIQGYKAITHDMVTSELRPHLITHGVLATLNQISGTVVESGKSTSSGTPITRCEGFYSVEFINIDKPEERYEVHIFAVAEDQNDKGPGKAASYAMKYALLKTFNIETGESDESRQDQKPNPITQDQHKELIDICTEKGFPLKTLDVMAKKLFQSKRIEDLPRDVFDVAKKELESKEAVKQ